MFFICALFVLVALLLDTPAKIISNYITINISRSVLVTDYIALAGIGAALLNSAVSVLLYLVLLIVNKQEPNGRLIAALFVTMGFSLFGKNLFNTLPVLIGIWLYTKHKRVRFSSYLVQAMLCATIAPLVSEIAFLDVWTSPVRIIAAYGVGLFVGFIFPIVAEASKRMHQGYCLYNSGIAGGFIATFFAGFLRSLGIDVIPEMFWDTSHTQFLAILAYVIAAIFIIFGIIADKPINAYKKLKRLLYEKDVREADYRIKYGNSCYINIGIMCIVSTSATLLLNIPINGPVLGGILTVAGFAAAGKHMYNTVPILAGSIFAANLNHIDLIAPANSLAILFSTGLAPVSGMYGWRWGIAIGFLHVSVAIYIGSLNCGLNLYNNGFAEGFVVITIVPIIVFMKDIIKKRTALSE